MSVKECQACGAIGSQAHAPNCKGRKVDAPGEHEAPHLENKPFMYETWRAFACAFIAGGFGQEGSDVQKAHRIGQLADAMMVQWRLRMREPR